MKDLYKYTILNNIGDTPFLKLKNIAEKGEVLVKLEYLNPGGSIKDRMALYLINKAEEAGKLRKGYHIIEATSGNTGVALSMIAASKDYKMHVVMPENMAIEKYKLMKLFGAEVVLVSQENGLDGAIKLTNEMANQYKNVYLPRQFENPLNIEAHELTTGKEILIETKGKVDAFVAGVGTGGTLMGVGQALKKVNPNVKIIAIEPATCAVMSGCVPGNHGIHGIGDGFIPPLLDMDFIDGVETVEEKEAIDMTRFLIRKYGLLVGISSGANVVVAKKIAQELGKGSIVVTVLPDKAERYISTGLLNF